MLREALEFALTKLESIRKLGDFPFATRDGVWQTIPSDSVSFLPAHGSWTVGFTPGLLWLAYRVTAKREYADEAFERCRRFLHRKDDDTTHDLGFVFYPSYVQGYQLTGEIWLRDGALAAARTLARRFNNRGGFIRAWGALGTADRAGQTTVDAMMNLALLYWASEVAHEPDLAAIATTHAKTTRRYIVRDDGWTYHAYEFDTETGAPIRGFTHQGYSDDSTWSRGQSWGIYGFARSASLADRVDFLRVSESLADCFLDRLPEDRIPYWDFDDPSIPHAVRDSSAGAIAAAGLMELSANIDNPDASGKYREAAVQILEALYEHSSSKDILQQDGTLLHGTWHKKAGFGVDSSLIFGEYYFMEALVRAISNSQ